jgi:aminoglycoside phosphotransferase family enzyme
VLDPAEELAYLWVECQQARDEQPACVVLESYRRESGDTVSPRLNAFYRSRRALVRAKIVAWHLYDPAVSHLADWADRANAYVALSERCARSVLADTSGVLNGG